MAHCSRCGNDAVKLKVIRCYGKTEFACRRCTYDSEEGEWGGCFN